MLASPRLPVIDVCILCDAMEFQMSLVMVDQVRVTAAGNISRKDAARALGLSPKTLCEWAARGLGPAPIKVGGRVYYRWSDVLDFAAGKQI